MECRMGDRHVIALIVDVADRLPIDVHHIPRLRRIGLERTEAVGRRLLSVPCHKLADGGLRPRLEAHKYESVPDFLFERDEAMRHRIEPGKGSGLGHSAKRAVKIEGPAVKRADHGGLAMASLASNDPRTAMAA